MMIFPFFFFPFVCTYIYKEFKVVISQVITFTRSNLGTLSNISAPCTGGGPPIQWDPTWFIKFQTRKRVEFRLNRSNSSAKWHVSRRKRLKTWLNIKGMGFLFFRNHQRIDQHDYQTLPSVAICSGAYKHYLNTSWSPWVSQTREEA